MKTTALVAWIGLADLKASRGELRDGVGPIANATSQRRFDEIHLLSDHKAGDAKAFVAWLKQQGATRVKVWPCQLSGPTRFNEIYEAVINALETLAGEGVARQFTFHVSPGTPAMAAVWILLAKTKFPAELIESSPEEGVRTISLPFEIAADYLPARSIESDDQVMRLTQGLPPEVPEFGAIIHRCQKMKTLIAQARRIAVEDVPVVVQGESGTGKELVARAIHASSRRAEERLLQGCEKNRLEDLTDMSHGSCTDPC